MQLLTEIMVQSIANALIDIWIARSVIVFYVITDWGKQFKSELFLELSKVIGFHRLRTTAYHLQCNGIIERTHRTVKTAIMVWKKSWLKAISIDLLGKHSAPNEFGFSLFTGVTGSNTTDWLINPVPI